MWNIYTESRKVRSCYWKCTDSNICRDSSITGWLFCTRQNDLTAEEFCNFELKIELLIDRFWCSSYSFRKKINKKFWSNNCKTGFRIMFIMFMFIITFIYPSCIFATKFFYKRSDLFCRPVTIISLTTPSIIRDHTSFAGLQQ